MHEGGRGGFEFWESARRASRRGGLCQGAFGRDEDVDSRSFTGYYSDSFGIGPLFPCLIACTWWMVDRSITNPDASNQWLLKFILIQVIFTLDGSEPTLTHGQLGAAGMTLTLSQSAVLRAIAVMPGKRANGTRNLFFLPPSTSHTLFPDRCTVSLLLFLSLSHAITDLSWLGSA